MNLDRAVLTLAEGYATAHEVNTIPREGEQGTLSNGTWIRSRTTAPGEPWTGVGGSDNEIAEVVRLLSNGMVWNPDTATLQEIPIKMSRLSALATIGPTHDLIGHPHDGDGRGAFRWTPLNLIEHPPTQQSLWSADGANQTTISTAPTHGGLSVDEELARRMVQQRSRWFIKRGMRWTSQATTMAHTRAPLHGGAAWTALARR